MKPDEIGFRWILELILLVTFSLHLDLTTESSDVNKREMQQPKLGWNSPHSASFLPKQWGSANNFGSLPSNTSHALRLTLPETCSSLVQQVDVLSTQNVG